MNDIDAVNVPGYRIVSRIMAGGMATVYVAEQLKLGSRRVAIKIFRNSNPDHTKARHKRFAQEALIARNLQHPHIVQIFDYGSTDEFQFLTMEYLAHGDLKQRIREGLQPPQVMQILQQVASALALLHQNDIVHRDIKPANILFREPDHAVLADFGIARSIEQNTQLTNTGFVLGTPSYMSPEQINGGRVTAKTDIYALGVLFYEMLTGHLPYRGDSVQSVATQHLMAPVPPLPLNVRRLQPLLNRLMAKKAEDRIASGSELLQMLARIDSSRGFAVRPPSFVQIHVRKIVAVAALMFCSVAITWAGISQLPYWLSDAAPVDSRLPYEESIAMPLPQAEMMPQAEMVLQAKTAPQVAMMSQMQAPVGHIDDMSPQGQILEAEINNAADAATVPESSFVAENKTDLPTASTPEQSGVRSASRSQGSASEKMDVLKNNNKSNKNVRGDSIKSPAQMSAEAFNLADDVDMAAPQQVAEQRAAYDIGTTEADAEQMPAGSDSKAVVPAEPASEKKKIPSPVISYF